MKSLIVHTLFFGFALATVGCSPTKDVVTKQLDEVKSEMTALRAENAALKDRVDVLEAAPKTERVGADATEDTGSGDRPTLEVVHLTPQAEPSEAATVVAPPMDDSPPMVIVGDDAGVKEVEPTESDPKAKSQKASASKQRHPQKRGR